MADPWTPEQETRFALATLVGALVHSLEKSNPGTAAAFCSTLENRYRDVRDEPSIPPSYLETIKMARDAVKAFGKEA